MEKQQAEFLKMQEELEKQQAELAKQEEELEKLSTTRGTCKAGRGKKFRQKSDVFKSIFRNNGRLSKKLSIQQQ